MIQPETYFLSIFLFSGFFLACLALFHFLSLNFKVYQKTTRPIAWLSYSISQIHAPISGGLSLYCISIVEPGPNNENWYFGTSDLMVLTLLFTLVIYLSFCLEIA